MCALANSVLVSITVISGAPGAAVSPANKRPVGHKSIDGTANLRVANLRLRAVQLAFGRGQVTLRLLECGFVRYRTHRLEVFRRSIKRSLCLHQCRLGSVQIPTRNRSLRKKLLAAFHDALIQVEISLGLRQIGLQP